MSDLYIIGGGVLALILALFGIFRAGKSSGQKDAEHDALQEDVETARRINRVRAADNAAAAHDSLRERSPGGDL